MSTVLVPSKVSICAMNEWPEKLDRHRSSIWSHLQTDESMDRPGKRQGPFSHPPLIFYQTDTSRNFLDQRLLEKFLSC